MSNELSSYHKERYGKWAGNERGIKADPDACAAEVMIGMRFYQCSRKRGYGSEGAFCKQHAKKRGDLG